MPRSVVKILLSVTAAIASVPLYFLSGAIFNHSVIRLSPDLPWSWCCGVATSVVIGACWAIIWRASIRWTRRRTALAAGAVIAAWLATGGVMALSGVLPNHDDELMIFTPLAGVAVCLAGLLAVWRETPTERRARASAAAVPCPVCGYNLAGLKQTGCPECGVTFTVEQIAGLRSDASDL